MVSKKALNAANLEGLGAPRLAELLIEISAGNAAAKRRLRLELAGLQSPIEVAREVRKRLATIRHSRSFVDWSRCKALAEDLNMQRRAVAEQVAPADPAEALDLMWRFMDLARSVFDRCDDSSGSVIGVFHEACRDLGRIAAAAKPDPEALAGQTFRAIQGNDYGQYDHLIAILAPLLGERGLDRLKARVVALSQTPVTRPRDAEREVIGWGSGGALYADDIAERSRVSTVRLALQDIADAQGDVDGFIAQYDEEARKVPKIAAEIAQRLLAAGRAEEAWGAVETVEEKRSGWIPVEWEEARLAVLEALGRADKAQAFRWTCFERSLSASHLRAYLKRLPDFDDVEAEERALAFVQGHSNIHAALAFLISWPALRRVAALVEERSGELNGDHYEVLTPAAEALSPKHPLAATLLLRAMIDFSLNESRSSRYGHAARHLAECERLAETIDDFGPHESHADYAARLQEQHGRKSSFWSAVATKAAPPGA